MEIRSNALVAVIGGGTMGIGIAQVASMAGHPVVIVDRSPRSLDAGRAAVSRSLAGLVKRGMLDQMASEAIQCRIVWTTNIEKAAPAALAIEAIVERMDAKTDLFNKLEAVVGETAIIASNTSSLSIAKLAHSLRRRDRFLGLHFFNPVPAMQLVEVVPASATSLVVLAACGELMERWGKRPVVVRDVPGFIVNRVARPYYAEGFAAFGEGIPASTIDTLLTKSGGFRMGPLALADLIGNDVNHSVACSVYEAYGRATRFRPQDAQRQLVERNHYGRKSGKGVYDHSAPPAEPDFIAPCNPPSIISISEPGLLLPLVAAAHESGILVAVDPTIPAEAILVRGSIMALGDGRRLAKRAGVDVILDHARSFEHADVVAITSNNESAISSAAGFFTAIGRKVLRVSDRPGQLTLRTLAQLANAAADAVTDGIAASQGIDDALVYGANHPEGPLAWARRVGHKRVGSALNALAKESGDAMYRPSLYFARTDKKEQLARASCCEQV